MIYLESLRSFLLVPFGFDHSDTHMPVPLLLVCTIRIQATLHVYSHIRTFMPSCMCFHRRRFFSFIVDEQLNDKQPIEHHFPTKSQGACNQTFFTHPFFPAF